MSQIISTGLRDKVLDTGSVKSVLNLGFINIYSGVAPATADAAATGTLLCAVSNNSTATGLTFGTASAGALPKNPAEVWSGLNVVGGTASYYRHVAAGDTGGISTTEARIQGVCGLAGADLNLTNLLLTGGAQQLVDYYAVSLNAA
jgi:hypothetical protein